MKTTIELPDELLRRAKQVALERGTSLKAVIESALVQALGRTSSRQPPLRTVVWPPASIEGPLSSSADILSMIRRERDSSGQASRYGNSGSEAAYAQLPVTRQPKTRQAPARRKK